MSVRMKLSQVSNHFNQLTIWDVDLKQVIENHSVLYGVIKIVGAKE